MNFALNFLVVFCLALVNLSSSADSNGFSSKVNWIEYEDAIQDTTKPSMIILHKSWCPACKNLKPKLSESFDFEKLSEKFSMVNAKENDPVHDMSKFNLDGGYIPRIFFLDSSGDLLEDIKNAKGNPEYKYFYYNAESVISSMKQVLDNGDPSETKAELWIV